MKQQTVTRGRRFAAYFLDGVIVLVLAEFLISTLLPKNVTESAIIDNPFVSFLLSIMAIILKFGYYIYFWNKSRLGRTLGQIVFQLKVKHTVTLQQCIKRLLLMNISAIYLCIAMHYMYLSSIHGDMQNYFVIVAVLSTLIMQLIYAHYINKVDKVTGIEIVSKQKITYKIL